MYLENKGFMKGKWITTAVILLIIKVVIMTLNSAVIGNSIFNILGKLSFYANYDFVFATKSNLIATLLINLLSLVLSYSLSITIKEPINKKLRLTLGHTWTY